MSTKEQYWKYSLITIILVMGVVIFFKATPFLGGLLGAATIYILLRNQMLYLIEKKHMKKSLMATLMLIETILIFLIPISLVVWLLISKLQAINLDPKSLMEPIGHVSKPVTFFLLALVFYLADSFYCDYYIDKQNHNKACSDKEA